MRKALLVFGAVFLAGLIFTAVAVAADANSLVVDDNGNVGIRTTTPLDSLHVNGQIRSNANMIMGTPSSVPDDIWGGPYLTNQTGFIGSMGGYALDMVWNGYRRIPDDKYNVRGINGSDTVNAISLDDIGIRFKTKDGMSNGDDQPPTRMIINRNGNVGIGLINATDLLHVNGQIRLNSNVVMSSTSNVPNDIWGGPYLINQTGFIGHMGSYALDIVWNGYRRNPDNKYNVVGINGSDTINAIRLGDSGIRFDSQDGMSNGDNIPAMRMLISNNGNIGIGTSSPQEKLHVAGNVLADAYNNPSDARWKENIEPIGDALELVSQLRGVSFDWTDPSHGTGPQIGVIAQEVEQVLPEVVHTDSQGYKSVEYAKLVAPLIEAVKKLKSDNDALRSRNQALEARSDAFEDRLKTIEMMLEGKANQAP